MIYSFDTRMCYVNADGYGVARLSDIKMPQHAVVLTRIKDYHPAGTDANRRIKFINLSAGKDTTSEIRFQRTFLEASHHLGQF